MPTIDVRELAPPVRHTTIFSELDALPTGDTLNLIVDHSPDPLRYQLDATNPHQFRWEVVMGGPVEWHIDITKLARTIDVRATIEAGGEPFNDIMAEVGQLDAGQVLVVVAPFEPVPLEGVLAAEGYRHMAEELDATTWRTTFYPEGS